MIYAEIMDGAALYTEAIQRSCDVLEQHGIVTKQYYQGILSSISQYGGYFYLGEGVCMPNAKPEDGVLASGLCIVKLNTPVDFEGKKVHIFFTLAARDESSHYTLMKQIAGVCSKKQSLRKMLGSRTREEMLKIMEEKL